MLSATNDMGRIQFHARVDAKADAPIVLVVDDHPVNRKLLAIQLGLLGLRGETAENGEEAIAMWRDGRFVLVITDCHMPKMNGYELTQLIRKIEADEVRPRTPIFAWTANALAGEVERCHAAGMDDLLVKPAGLAQLKAVLSKWQVIADTASIHIEHEESGNTPAELIDYKRLDAITDNAADKAAILRDFLAQTRFDLIDLEAAMETHDIPTSVRIAHRMKGASWMVGALVLSSAIKVMESSVRQGKLEGVGEVRMALEQLATYLSKTIEKDMGGGG